MLALLDPTSLAVVAAVLGTSVTILVAGYVGVRFIVEARRLPAAVRDAELITRVSAREDRLRELEEQIREREATLAERDQAEGEAEHWRSVVETLKAEHANLGARRQEIAAVEEEFREASERLAAKVGELDLANRQVGQARDALTEAQAKREKAEAAIASAEEQRQEVSRLEEQCESLTRQKNELTGDVETYRNQTMALALEIDRRERDLQGLDRKADELRAAVAGLEQRANELEEAGRLTRELSVECGELQRQRAGLVERLDSLREEELRIHARVARLREEAQFAGAGEVDDKVVLADLTEPPTCFLAEGGQHLQWRLAQQAQGERQALDRVALLLEQSGLHFSRRTINAFHTSLKTAVISPLTVLAGISGTGKSQLPRRYADAMGIHFLKIPVQPRWDGPQDLFGFYNYIEKRYKATELARALVHMDPYNWPEEAERFNDRMLLVLLDEMNLARVEYYFSEFLSRLEGRPSDERAKEEQERRPSEIDIDAARNGRSARVYAGQNVLFVGTMNEDESTMALSDKVMDRANILRFARPPTLRAAIPTPEQEAVADKYLPRLRWTGEWMRGSQDLAGPLRDRAARIVSDLNDVMDGLGRPFGHRMSQAMLHYVANYPADDHAKVNLGLADQIEQRIMPKLRGVDVSDARHELHELVKIVREELRDEELANAIDEALRKCGDSIGIFNWRGFARRQDD